MAKLVGAIGTQAGRYKPIKRRKTERNAPGRKRRKAYRGQGRV